MQVSTQSLGGRKWSEDLYVPSEPPGIQRQARCDMPPGNPLTVSPPLISPVWPRTPAPSSVASDTRPPSRPSEGRAGGRGSRSPIPDPGDALMTPPAPGCLRRLQVGGQARAGGLTMHQQGQGPSTTQLPLPDTRSLRDPEPDPGPPAESLLRKSRG